MTRRPKKPAKPKLPKPVEAWGIVTAGGRIVRGTYALRAWAVEDQDHGERIIRVRIVPVRPKKRRVRKEKQK